MSRNKFNKPFHLALLVNASSVLTCRQAALTAGVDRSTSLVKFRETRMTIGRRRREGVVWFFLNHIVHISLHTFFTECIMAISPELQKEKTSIVVHKRLI